MEISDNRSGKTRSGDRGHLPGASRPASESASRRISVAGWRRAGASSTAALPAAAELVDGVAGLATGGGKRLRPALVYFTFRACGGGDEAAGLADRLRQRAAPHLPADPRRHHGPRRGPARPAVGPRRLRPSAPRPRPGRRRRRLRPLGGDPRRRPRPHLGRRAVRRRPAAGRPGTGRRAGPLLRRARRGGDRRPVPGDPVGAPPRGERGGAARGAAPQVGALHRRAAGPARRHPRRAPRRRSATASGSTAGRWARPSSSRTTCSGCSATPTPPASRWAATSPRGSSPS